MAKAEKTEIQKRVSLHNRKASHDYFFTQKYTAGIVLKGSEVKSIRQGRVNMQDAFALFIRGELILRGVHISPYETGGMNNHEARVDRKLLLNKDELRKLEDKLKKDQGSTIVPVQIFTTDRGLVKVEIALAKGKKLYDKRDDIRDRDLKRDMDRGE